MLGESVHSTQDEVILSLEFLGSSLWPGRLFAPWRLALGKGQCLAILGASGIGKSSLLQVLLQLYKGRTLDGFQLDKAPQKLSILTQENSLLAWRTALQNVTLRDSLEGRKPDWMRAKACLESFGLEPETHDKKPNVLSGGMRQRVGLARILYERAPLALLDEPFCALDWPKKLALHHFLLKTLHDCSLLLVTHDPFEAARLANKIIILAGSPAYPLLDLDVPGPRPRSLSDTQTQNIALHCIDVLNEAAA